MSIRVVIPVYRQSKYLGTCLRSVISQAEKEDQIVVVCDDDDAEEIEFVRSRIEWFNHMVGNSCPINLMADGKNKGVSAARNEGALRGNLPAPDWIKFLDCDDQLAPFALSTFRASLDKIPGDVHLLVGGMIQVIDGCLGNFVMPNMQMLFRQNPTLVSNSFVRWSAFADIGGFDTRIHFEEDWELWLRMHRKFGNGFSATIAGPICYYGINTEERRQKQRKNTITLPTENLVDGKYETKEVEIREYLTKQYNLLK